MRYTEMQRRALQEGQATPFIGALMDLTRKDDEIHIKIPKSMLDNAGISSGENTVEVWREMDGTICFRIATKCEVCERGAKLYELDMGFAKKNVCAEDYFKLTGQYPEEAEIPEQR